MDPDPNKTIDDLLKSYARKRREDAGAPIEMHPATRKMLQAEVAKLSAQTEPEPNPKPERRFDFWATVRPAFVVALFFALLITAASIWLRLYTAKPMELAKY